MIVIGIVDFEHFFKRGVLFEGVIGYLVLLTMGVKEVGVLVSTNRSCKAIVDDKESLSSFVNT